MNSASGNKILRKFRGPSRIRSSNSFFFALEIMSIVCRSLQDGENYVNWSEEVKCFLMGQECWIILSGAEGEPEDVASKKLFSCCSGLVGLCMRS